MNESNDKDSAFSRFLKQGIVVSWHNNELNCSFPAGLSLGDAFERASIDEEAFARELTRQITLDQTAKPIIASGPLTPGQERLLRSSSLLSDQPMLVKPTTIRIEGPLNVKRLELALGHTLARFSALRAQLRLRADNVFIQTITAPEDHLLQHIDLSSSNDPDEALKSELQRMTNEPMGALNAFFRAKLFQIKHHQHCLAVSIHHMVSDMWSVSLFYDTLSQAYTKPVDEPMDARISARLYFDAIRTLHQHRCSVDGQKSLEHWCEMLKPLPAPMQWKGIPTQRPVISLKISDHGFFIDQNTVDSADHHARGSGITRAQQLLAAWAVTLRLFCENNDIAIGVMAACRTRPEIEKEMGFFSNPVVICARFGQSISLANVVNAIKRELTDALAHQETPIQDIISRLAQSPEFDLQRFYQTMFAYNNVPTTELTLSELRCWETDPTLADLRTELSTIDVRLSLTPLATGIRAILTYKADVFKAARIKQMADLYCRCLHLISTVEQLDWKDVA